MVLMVSACSLVLLSEWSWPAWGSKQGKNGAIKPAEITLSRPAASRSLVEKDLSILRCPDTASPTWHSPNERVGGIDTLSDVADPSITGSSPTVTNEKTKRYALAGYCNSSIQYLIQGELMQGCLKSSFDQRDQLKFGTLGAWR